MPHTHMQACLHVHHAHAHPRAHLGDLALRVLMASLQRAVYGRRTLRLPPSDPTCAEGLPSRHSIAKHATQCHATQCHATACHTIACPAKPPTLGVETLERAVMGLLPLPALLPLVELFPLAALVGGWYW